MTTAGPTIAGQGRSQATGGRVAWTNPNNVTSTSAYATCTCVAQQTDNLVIDTFGLSIPTGATILGITLTVYGYMTTGNETLGQVFVGKDIYNQTGLGADIKSLSITTSAGDLTLGGSADAWGSAWSAADLNAASFGFMMRKVSGSATDTFHIRNARVTVDYTPPNTAPTITAGPTTTYASGTATYNGNTWGVTFTAHDAEQTGANALTYYIRTSATWGAGTQVATGTCTSDSSKVLTGLAYDASGVVVGSQTLYLHIYDGTTNTVTAGNFTLLRQDPASLVLATSAGVATAAVSALSAKATVVPGTSAGVATAALNPFVTKPLLALSASAGVATAAATVISPEVFLSLSAAGVATASAVVMSRALFTLQSDGVGATGNMILAAGSGQLVLSASAGAASAALVVASPALLALSASAGVSAVTELFLTANAYLALPASSGAGSGALTVISPEVFLSLLADGEGSALMGVSSPAMLGISTPVGSSVTLIAVGTPGLLGTLSTAGVGTMSELALTIMGYRARMGGGTAAYRRLPAGSVLRARE